MITENDITRALDTQTVNAYVARGRQVRSAAFHDLFAALFTAPSRVAASSVSTGTSRNADA